MMSFDSILPSALARYDTQVGVSVIMTSSTQKPNSNLRLVAGVDEAGRGPLLGPVATAAVILDSEHVIDGLADSKKLSEKKRDKLFGEIIQHALAYSVIFVSPKQIDEINILQATLLGMKTAVESLPIVPEHALIDGNKTLEMSVSNEAVVGGDALHAEISAASILAKVARDQYMYGLHAQYPEFGIDRHKGYPTKLHREMLEKHGALPEHRRSFRPVSDYL